jgi:hypothetical protein
MQPTKAEVEDGARLILKRIEASLKSGSGCLIGRFGTIECNVSWANETMGLESLHERQKDQLEKNAGIFPFTQEAVKEWCSDYKEAFKTADVLALGWYAPIVEQEKELMKRWGWHGEKVVLRALEPYYVPPELRWTRLLEGKDVCVVNSFTESMKGQVLKGESRVWPGAGSSIWPSGVHWHFVHTGYAPSLALGKAGWNCEPQDWREAVDWAVAEVLKTGARMVLLGCGGLAMCMARRLKEKGKVCLVLGGATQVLFGIKGRRWETHPVISKFWNEDWVWPMEEETPAGCQMVEGGCYWSKAA